MQLNCPDVDTKARYNPIFILRFSMHCLSEGFIEPLEFAGLGLLAIAFMSISSPSDKIRSLGYETLGTLQDVLKVMMCFIYFPDLYLFSVYICMQTIKHMYI